MLVEVVGLQISVEGNIGIDSYCPYCQFPQGIWLLSGNWDAGLDASDAGVRIMWPMGLFHVPFSFTGNPQLSICFNNGSKIQRLWKKVPYDLIVALPCDCVNAIQMLGNWLTFTNGCTFLWPCDHDFQPFANFWQKVPIGKAGFA